MEGEVDSGCSERKEGGDESCRGRMEWGMAGGCSGRRKGYKNEKWMEKVTAEGKKGEEGQMKSTGEEGKEGWMEAEVNERKRRRRSGWRM